MNAVEAQGGVGAGCGLQREEAERGPPDASRDRGARRRAETDAGQGTPPAGCRM